MHTTLTSMDSSGYNSTSTKVKSGQVKLIAKHTSKLSFSLHLSAIRAVTNAYKKNIPFYYPTNISQ